MKLYSLQVIKNILFTPVIDYICHRYSQPLIKTTLLEIPYNYL